MANYLVPRVASPPALDGRGLDGVWASLPPVGPFGLHDGTPARQATWARLGYDATHLYVAFDCVDDDIWGSYRQRDEPVYDEEVVEVFLDFAGLGTEYAEVEVSPHNVVLDGVNRWLDGRHEWDPSWSCAGLQTAVTVRGVLDDLSHLDQGWSATLALPFAGLEVAVPAPGDRWRANLYRIDRDRRRQVDEFQAWCATQDVGASPFYNVPARFGTLVFG